MIDWGYWGQRADERFVDPPPRTGGSRNLQWSVIWMEDPKRTPGSALLLYV